MLKKLEATCSRDPQDFYLGFKDALFPIAEEEFKILQGEITLNDNCHLWGLKQSALADAFVDASFKAAIWFHNLLHEDKLREQDIPLALVAQGSYGREELSFLSDVDIQIVSRFADRSEFPEAIKDVILHFEYLFVFQEVYPAPRITSYSRVDISEKDMAPEAIISFIPMMQNRFITGDPLVYSEFISAVKTASLLNEDKIIEHCSQQKSYYELQNTVFEQEPNIKEEMRRLYWALCLVRLRHHLNATNQHELLHELYANDILNPGAFKKIQRAFNFLSKIRYLLHCCQKGAHRDVLSYEVRDIIAEGMGYEVRAFFQEYFFKAVYPLKRYSRNLFWESMVADAYWVESLSDTFGVNAEGQIIFKAAPEEFKPETSLWIFKIFTWVAEKNYHLSYPVTRAIEVHLDEMGPLFLGGELSPEIQGCFQTVITAPYFARALRLMHEFRLLGECYIREFKDITGMLQDIYVHKFPTDMHILSALDALNNLQVADKQDPFLVDLLDTVRCRTTLNLSVLLHDIGKGAKMEGQNEELIGAKLIPGILKHLGYGDQEEVIHNVAFLVEKHLTMWDLMLLDPEDDDTFDMVWDLVNQEPELLKMLVLLTYADRGGTKIKMSKTQIEQLKLFYQFTLHHKKRSSVPADIKLQFLEMVRLPTDLRSQMEIYSDFIQSSETFTAEMLFKPEEPSELIVCAKDSPKLLYGIAAVLAFNHLEIVEASVQTLQDNVFDVFKVTRVNGEYIDHSDFYFIQTQVRRDLRQIFIEHIPLSEIYKGRSFIQDEQSRIKDVKLKIKVIGRAVKIATHEVFGNFLMETKAFADSNMEIQRAVMQHHQGTAVNIFYVRDQDVEKILSNQESFATLMRGLLSRLIDSPASLLEEPAEVV